MKTLLTKLFAGPIAPRADDAYLYDESIERLADILVANHEARQRAEATRARQQRDAALAAA